jgi:succinate dehydrogenase / fumarate reductase, flavoprotein subunit
MTETQERRSSTSVLVVGTGAAGLRAAIELAELGVQVLCVGKRRRDDAHTVLAAGGINAALGTLDPEDSWEQHAADTLREGYWLGDPRSVELLCREAPAAIDDLVRWGARFAREADGRLTQRFFGAHRYRRTCFAGDYTGREIQRTLVRRAAEAGVATRDDIYITRLLVHDDFPDQDPSLHVNLVWALDGVVTRQPVPPVSERVAAFANGPSELETAERLLE